MKSRYVAKKATGLYRKGATRTKHRYASKSGTSGGKNKPSPSPSPSPSTPSVGIDSIKPMDNGGGDGIGGFLAAAAAAIFIADGKTSAEIAAMLQSLHLGWTPHAYWITKMSEADRLAYYQLMGVSRIETIAQTHGRSVLIDRMEYSLLVNRDKQGRHLLGDPRLKESGSAMRSMEDAQLVLGAFHSGQASILGMNSTGNVFVRVPSVTGVYRSGGAGVITDTNIFAIKGTVSLSIVPASPTWQP